MLIAWLPSIVFLLLFIYYARLYKLQQVAQHDWKQVMGLIESHDVRVKEEAEGVSCTCRLTYHYQVGGQLYTGHRLRWSDNVSEWQSVSSREINAITSHYTSKTPVKVYYNPKNPRESFLKYSQVGLLALLNLAALIIFSIWMIFNLYGNHSV